MLCLRRISLDAKSRLWFLSRSHSSTNDSMPKSTAISRLIHKKFLQQNGNNSPQAIFVFLQQRGIRTKADKEKSHAKNSEDEFKFGFGPSGAKPKNDCEKDLHRTLHKYFVKSGKSEEEFEKMLKEIEFRNTRRYFFNHGLGAGLVLAMFIVWTTRKSEEEFEKMLKEINLYKVYKFFFNVGYVIGAVVALMMYTARMTFERCVILWPKVPEFKFGFGPSGAKPKNKWEESLYRALKESFVKSGKSEEEFEQALKEIDFDKFRQYSIIIGRDLAFMYMSKPADHKEKSDAKDSEDEFKFGIGPSGTKPKSNFEKDVYRYLHKDFMKSGMSEEEFEIWLKLFDLDQIRLNAVATYYLTLGVILASMTFIVSAIFVEPIVKKFFVLFIALPVMLFFCIRAFLSMT